MKSIVKKIQILFVACATVSSLASSVIEDSKRHFILDDEVLNSSAELCEDGSGKHFSPENSFYSDSNGVPVRHYRIALPSNAKPSVSVTDDKVLPLGASLCKSTPAKALPVSVSEPYLKDYLWQVDVLVPLYLVRGQSVSLRQKFRLEVDFGSSMASGRNPGARALMLVANAKSAARFGVASANNSLLRREASSDFDGIVQLAQLVVGDKNMASFAEDGMYAVDFKSVRNSLLKVMRQSELDGIPIEKLCVYGASPDTLPDMAPGASLRNPNHIFELPIRVNDRNSNKIFDDGDTLYFVGYGNAFWKRIDSEPGEFFKLNMAYFHSYSPYSYYQYFVLGYKEVGKGLRLETLTPPKSSPKDIEWFRYVRAEKELLLRDTYFGKPLDWESSSGKEWFWIWHGMNDTTVLSPSDLSFSSTKDLPGLVSEGKGYVGVSFFPYRSIESSAGVAQKTDNTYSTRSYEERMLFIRFGLKVNGESHSWSQGSLLPGGNFGFSIKSLKKSNNEYELTLLPNTKQSDRFDGYTVAYQWNPTTVSIDSSEWLLPGFATGVVRIPVGKNEDLRLMKFKDFKPVGLLKISNGFAVDSIGENEDVRYMLFRDKDRRKAISLEGIPKTSSNVVQNLSKISSKTEYLIITPEEFLAPAESLAVFRSSDKSASSLVTSLVSAENIYRHYTGGALSPIAIRNFIAYARSVSPDLRFVLLAGSGHYDYRGINAKLGKNYMPPFEKEAVVTEDFFAVLDSGESVRSGKPHDVDIAVGRLPVSSVEEFYDYNEKAKDYDEIGKFNHGEWKTTLLLAADDARNGTESDPTPHTMHQEDLARMIDSSSAKLGFRMNLKKVYLLDYEYDAAGQKQDAVNDFMSIMNQGALMTMYFGHGSKVAWASEGLLKPSYVSKLSNKKVYTVLNSFSCTVGRFDEGGSRSLSETFVVAPEAGAIAAVGATRETYASYNQIFAHNFISRAVLENGNYLGLAYMQAKDNIIKNSDIHAVYNSEHYVLIGEPVIRMPYANLKISIDSPVESIKALDKMKLSGTVSGLSSGSIALTLREGRINKPLPLISRDSTLKVPYDGPLIYSEIVPVVGGRFETEFITPKKLNIGDSLAELRAWVYSSNQVAVGRYLEDSIKISGISNYADSLKDKTPPSISIQSCYGGTASSFADNQFVKLQTPACLQVIVEDETALDYREQADEGISFEMIGLENPYHPSPFLEQSSKRAVARKALTSESYPPGNYAFKVRAMDVLGNASTKQINLQITDAMQTGLSDVFNVPNPMGKAGTTFYFKNLSADQNSKVSIFIYNQHGRLVKVIKDAKSGETHWNGKDNYGRLLANGLYHYVVRSEVSESSSESKKSKTKTWTKKQKLLISR
ncbi:C25 family cysteine peptidase [Fibrobacter sp.]|uniref:C25 family cysteine peptidase n=1 Tax=Fibrobacter sp. TaxID=35828 RepID=UPI0025C344B2|nr:C25 family cysteine peptidase [Fibrobacter sp.]MBR3072085.1 hypothetical protein [Fibrobacter sp.]